MFFPLYLAQNLHFSGWQIGIVVGVPFLVSLMSTVPLGIANDRFAPRSVLLAGIILSIMYYLFLPITPSFIGQVGLALIYGLMIMVPNFFKGIYAEAVFKR